VTADALINKFAGKHQSGKYYLDAYEEKFGRLVAGWVGGKEGKAISATPIIKKLAEAQEKNKLYRFGKVIALDLYITTAMLILWSAISRKSAKKRDEKNKLANEQEAEREILEVPTLFPLAATPAARGL